MNILNIFLLLLLLMNVVSYAGNKKNMPTGIFVESTYLYDLDKKKGKIVVPSKDPWYHEDAFLNPQGDKILYLVSKRVNQNHEAVQIRTADIGGGNQKIWLENKLMFNAFSWSPDGKYIFISPLTEKFSYMIIDIEKELAWTINLSKDLRNPVSPYWSQDGETLYYSVWDENNQSDGYDVVQINLSGTYRVPFFNVRESGHVQISPDESKATRVSIDDYDLHLIDVKTGRMELTKKTKLMEWDQFWSPDSQWIGVVQRNSMNLQIEKVYAVNAETKKWTRIYYKPFGTLSWWQPPTKPLPDCEKIIQEQLGPGRPLADILKEMNIEIHRD